MADRFRKGGLGYGEVKKDLFARVLEHFADARRRRDDLVAHPERVEDILAAEVGATERITSRLAELRENVVGPATLAVSDSLEVTILADKSVPFIVIKRIMSTCTGEGYENVSLAVLQKAPQVAAL